MLDPSRGDAIASAFGLGRRGRLRGPVARGEQGRVWRLETAAGAFAVKETFEPLADVEAEESAAFQEAAARAGCPVPRVVRTPAGAPAAAVGDVQLRLSEWVDLLPPDRAVDVAAVGAVLAALQRARFAGSVPEDPWYVEPVGAARWRELADGLTAAGGPFAAELAALVDELVALEALLAPPRSLATCHRDLWADNVLPVRGGGLCVIDWDNCGLADPAGELAHVLVEFAAGDDARVRALDAAYREAGGEQRPAGPGDFSLVIAQLGHIGETAIATWLDPVTPSDERARQVPRIEEFVTLALTRARVDGILAALG